MARMTDGARAVRAYLKAIDEGSLASTSSVSLGALPGFPAWSEDPDEIDAAADYIAENLPTGVLARLDRAQRILTLRRAADVLRDGGGDDIEAAFVKYAAEYGEKRGIEYEAWRDMGVTPAVLKAAGIR